MIVPARLVMALVKQELEEDMAVQGYIDLIKMKIMEAAIDNKTSACLESNILTEYIWDRLQRKFEAQGYIAVLGNKSMTFSWPKLDTI